MLICPLCVVRSITYAVVNLIKKDRNFALTYAARFLLNHDCFLTLPSDF